MEQFSELSIQKAREFHAYLLTLLASNENIEIDMQSVTAIDASCIQLLISCKNSAIQQKKEFSIINLNEDLEELFALLGADLYLGV